MNKFRSYFSVAALALAVSLAGCSAVATTGQAGTSSASSPQAVTVASVDEATHFDADDLSWDSAEEVAVTLADGASTVAGGSPSAAAKVDGDTVTISAAGTYRLSGNLSDGQVVIAAGEEDVVRIVLDGVELSSSTGSAFVVRSANEAIVFLADGSTNSVADAASYAEQAEESPNAALYSMADLTIAGSGALAVSGKYKDGIVSKDGLVLAAGTVTVNAADDGIRGKDYTVLLDGAYTVTAGGDGVTSDNEVDEGRGWLLVSGGALTVKAGDDGVKAHNRLAMTGGDVTVEGSEEGFEAAHIAVSGGTARITAQDDGINAAGGSSATGAQAGAQAGSRGGMGGGEAVGDYSVDISGGNVTINAQGDGLDSNGNATITGGTVVVNGPTSSGNGALDVNGELLVNGGTVAAAGSAGMVVTPGTSSSQSGVQLTFDSAVAAGTTVQLADSAGTVVATFVTAKQMVSLVYSSAAIEAGAEYTVYTGGTARVAAGVGEGTLDGAQEQGTVTAGAYTAARGPGGR
jgi:hypothetical protein